MINLDTLPLSRSPAGGPAYRAVCVTCESLAHPRPLIWHHSHRARFQVGLLFGSCKSSHRKREKTAVYVCACIWNIFLRAFASPNSLFPSSMTRK